MLAEHQQLLLVIARTAILQTLEDPDGHFSNRGKKQRVATRWLPTVGKIPDELEEERATFVTLTIDGSLRGCIGRLEACRSLAEDVAENAVSAAFHDPRFPPLSRDEFDRLNISISILSQPEEMLFASEHDLLSQIRPRTDGLILQEGERRGTFLPSVWAELPDQELFFEHLKLKAGLPAGYWSDTLRVFRYTAESIQ